MGFLTEFIFFAHGVDKVTWAETFVVSTSELLGSTIQSTTEAGADRQQTTHERTDQILSSSRGDDGVHGTRHGWTVVSSQHQDHLQESARVVRKAATEPQQRHDTANTDVVLEDIRNGHPSVEQLLTTIVGDGGNEGSRFPDQAELLGPGIVDGDLRNDGLILRLDGAILDQLLIDLTNDLWKLFKGVGNEETSLFHRLVLHGGGLEL
jgi:hypothetical protein